MKVQLDKGAYKPERAHELDAGYDIRTPIDFSVAPKGRALVDTGIHVEIPAGYVGFLKSKSGLNTKNGIIGEGVIDAGYTGSIKVMLDNQSNWYADFKKGDKIIQLVILPIFTEDIELVDKLTDTPRGNNGFGSTGK